jgi:hypothetical protein
MNKLYMYLYNGCSEWEDMILFTSEEEAMNYSKENPDGRIEIFIKSVKGYAPSYAYICNGVYHNGSELK